MEQKLQVGIITATHGLKGEVKVYPTTDDPGLFRRLKKVILDNGKVSVDLEIESVKYFKQFVVPSATRSLPVLLRPRPNLSFGLVLWRSC